MWYSKRACWITYNPLSFERKAIGQLVPLPSEKYFNLIIATINRHHLFHFTLSFWKLLFKGSRHSRHYSCKYIYTELETISLIVHFFQRISWKQYWSKKISAKLIKISYSLIIVAVHSHQLIGYNFHELFSKRIEVEYLARKKIYCFSQFDVEESKST